MLELPPEFRATGTEFNIEYAEGNLSKSFDENDVLNFINNSGINTGTSRTSSPQKTGMINRPLGLTNSTLYWEDDRSETD